MQLKGKKKTEKELRLERRSDGCGNGVLCIGKDWGADLLPEVNLMPTAGKEQKDIIWKEISKRKGGGT